jgi:hypothetical protein
VEGLKRLYPFCYEEYPMKIHFSAFGSNFDHLSSGTCMYVMQPNTLKCETSGYLHVNFSLGVMP